MAYFNILPEKFRKNPNIMIMACLLEKEAYLLTLV